MAQIGVTQSSLGINLDPQRQLLWPPPTGDAEKAYSN